jgi:pentatricopeptide repeat protein
MMVDLYGFVGDYDKAERTFFEIEKPDHIMYSTLIRACGLSKDVDKTKIWFSRLVDSGLELDVQAFNTFINALASTGDRGAVALAHDVIHSLDNEPRFANIQPDLMTYNSLLKCISVSGDPDAGEQATKVLGEIEERGFNPDHISLSYCYKACVESADYARSDDILQRIDLIRPAPGIKFFNSLLNEMANVGTKESVQKLEEVIQWLHNAAKTNPSLRPNVFSYGIAVKALTLLNELDGPAKISDLFTTMDRNNVKTDRAILATAVLYLASQDNPKFVKQAASLLRRIEDVDHFHLCEVVFNLLRVDEATEVVSLMNDILDRLASGEGKVGIWTKTMRRVLMTLSRKGKKKEASDVLLIAERFEKQRNAEGLLSPECYQFVIEAWQASSDPNREEYVKLHSKSKFERLGIVGAAAEDNFG